MEGEERKGGGGGEGRRGRGGGGGGGGRGTIENEVLYDAHKESTCFQSRPVAKSSGTSTNAVEGRHSHTVIPER